MWSILMKKLLIILLFFTTGFEHVSVLKNTFGYIKAFYKVKTKIVLDCNDCYLSIDDTSKLMQVNEVFANNPYMSSTAFIVSQTKDETVLTTSGHVCEEIILFTTELKFKKLGIELQENIIKNNDTFKDKSELLEFLNIHEREGKYLYPILELERVTQTNGEVLSDSLFDYCQWPLNSESIEMQLKRKKVDELDNEKFQRIKKLNLME